MRNIAIAAVLSMAMTPAAAQQSGTQSSGTQNYGITRNYGDSTLNSHGMLWQKQLNALSP